MGIMVRSQAANSAVIVRLDRTIQYAAAFAFKPMRLRLLDTRWSLSSGSPMARPGGGHDEHWCVDV
jgi:hypothetical protein